MKVNNRPSYAEVLLRKWQRFPIHFPIQRQNGKMSLDDPYRLQLPYWERPLWRTITVHSLQTVTVPVRVRYSCRDIVRLVGAGPVRGRLKRKLFLKDRIVGTVSGTSFGPCLLSWLTTVAALAISFSIVTVFFNSDLRSCWISGSDHISESSSPFSCSKFPRQAKLLSLSALMSSRGSRILRQFEYEYSGVLLICSWSTLT